MHNIPSHNSVTSDSSTIPSDVIRGARRTQKFWSPDLNKLGNASSSKGLEVAVKSMWPHTTFNHSAKSIVGQTPIYKIPALCKYFGIPSLLIKDESANPCGTHKDRKSAYVVNRVLRGIVEPTALCLITAGNAALSLAHFAASKRIPIVAFVGDIAVATRRQLESNCAQVIKLDLESRFWSNKELQVQSENLVGIHSLNVSNLATPFMSLAHEIAPYHPDVVVLPVGGGELFVGLAAGLRATGQRTRLIGVAVRRPDTVADKLYACHTPYREVLQRWTSGTSPHRLIYLDDESTLVETQGTLAEVLRCEASSAVAFDALRQLKFRRHERVMVVNTGVFSWSHLTLNRVPPSDTT